MSYLDDHGPDSFAGAGRQNVGGFGQDSFAGDFGSGNWDAPGGSPQNIGGSGVPVGARVGSGIFNTLNPFGMTTTPVHYPATNYTTSFAKFSPGKALGGLLGGAAGVPFGGALGAKFGPSFNMGWAGPQKNTGPVGSQADEWRRLQMARALGR